MAYQITFDKPIRRQIQNLPGHIKSRAKQQMAQLSATPRPQKSKELTSLDTPIIIGCGLGQSTDWFGRFLMMNKSLIFDMSGRKRLICTLI